MVPPGLLQPRRISCEPVAGRTGRHEHEPDQMHDGMLRYVPYIARAKMLLLRAKLSVGANVRYLAYSSDVGESVRPVVKPWMVNATYGMACAYCLADVGYTAYKAKEHGCSQDAIFAGCAHTATFQFLASLLLPAVIIHTVVHQVQHALEKPFAAKLPQSVLHYGPSGIGLVLIPFLPLTDPPCEYLIDNAFDRVWPSWREAYAARGHGAHGEHHE